VPCCLPSSTRLLTQRCPCSSKTVRLKAPPALGGWRNKTRIHCPSWSLYGYSTLEAYRTGDFSPGLVTAVLVGATVALGAKAAPAAMGRLNGSTQGQTAGRAASESRPIHPSHSTPFQALPLRAQARAALTRATRRGYQRASHWQTGNKARPEAGMNRPANTSSALSWPVKPEPAQSSLWLCAVELGRPRKDG
jgi:hypothetical protein